MYQSRQISSFSSVLALQQMSGPQELKHRELHLLYTVSVFFPAERETEPKKPQNVDRLWVCLPLRHCVSVCRRQVAPSNGQNVKRMDKQQQRKGGLKTCDI